MRDPDVLIKMGDLHALLSGDFPKMLQLFLCSLYVFPNLSDKVSTPCSKRKALNGEMHAPLSLSKIALIYVTKAASPGGIHKGNTVVARICLCNVRIFSGFLPIKLSGIYNNTSERCPMTANELCCRMYNDIRSILNRLNKIWGSKCVVNHKRNIMSMCNLAIASMSGISLFGLPNVSR